MDSVLRRKPPTRIRILDTQAADMSIGSPRQSWREHLATRLPPGISVEFAQKSLAEAGEGLGIHFDFTKLEQLPDTREAHRLVALASRGRTSRAKWRTRCSARSSSRAATLAITL